VRAAIDIHRRTGASFWDAMILRSAQDLGCQILHSEDQRWPGLRRLEVRDPFPA
jgi:predicted nucleic acid-binding protein